MEEQRAAKKPAAPETEEKPQAGHKISTVEGIIVLFLLLVLDTVEFVIVFVGLDDFGITDLLGSPIFLYLNMKGVPPARQLIAWLIEIFPYLGWLPLKSAGWGLTWWADAHPKSLAAKAFSAAAAATDVKKGGAQAAEKAGGTVATKAETVLAEEAAGTAEGAAKAGLSESEVSAKKAKEATEVFGGETTTPTEKVEEELLGEKPVVRAEEPEEEAVAEKPAGTRSERKTEDLNAEEKEEEPEEFAGARLGGAYEEEESVEKTMEEVEVEGNSVDLSGKRNNVIDAADRFGPQNPPADKFGRDKLAA
ncbi:MAG: hypothetical protein LiPW15_797 [Parcubacteria group bacterium LiPW_15]|nr:MAG: hypothetical protein LiPW15_797 [Parcubacteria group bacterium LiPW_15]